MICNKNTKQILNTVLKFTFLINLYFEIIGAAQFNRENMTYILYLLLMCSYIKNIFSDLFSCWKFCIKPPLFDYLLKLNLHYYIKCLLLLLCQASNSNSKRNVLDKKHVQLTNKLTYKSCVISELFISWGSLKTSGASTQGSSPFIDTWNWIDNLFIEFLSIMLPNNPSAR